MLKILPKPFVKWAGGKKQLLEVISANLPDDMGKTINRYAEPFIGGGAVLFQLLTRFSLKEIYIGDKNRALIHTYLTIRDHADSLIAELEKLESVYLDLSIPERKAMYYAKRARYNALLPCEVASIEFAALFLFLNRTCFNGLYRVNRKGLFNVPQGRYVRPQILHRENILAVSQALTCVKIFCGDFAYAKNFIQQDAQHTFIYLDPPYRPQENSQAFTAYQADGFSDAEQQRLHDFFCEMSQQGAKLLLSNSNDDFFENLYQDYNIQHVFARRMINRNGTERGKVAEILVRNYTCGEETGGKFHA